MITRSSSSNETQEICPELEASRGFGTEWTRIRFCWYIVAGSGGSSCSGGSSGGSGGSNSTGVGQKKLVDVRAESVTEEYQAHCAVTAVPVLTVKRS